MSWQPVAGIETLRARAQLLADCRQFFAERDVLEVSTPMLASTATTEPNIASLTVASALCPEKTLYLHSSPELAMKRLLAAGTGSIYQICTVFRDSDFGQQHRAEFTMLEWYRPNWRYQQLMDEVEALMASLTGFRVERTAQRISYRQLFLKTLGLDPFTADTDACRHCCTEQGITPPANMGEELDTWLDLLMALCVTPTLSKDGLTFVYDYPASQAALAQLREESGLQVAERFELYWGSLELANGFQELTDSTQQQARFQSENQLRRDRRLEEMPIDERFLAALEAGLPASAGVALGLDRVLMGLMGASDIREVLSFDDNY